MHNAQCTMHNYCIACGDVMTFRPFAKTILPEIHNFTALTAKFAKQNIQSVRQGRTPQLCIVHCAL